MHGFKEEENGERKASGIALKIVSLGKKVRLILVSAVKLKP